MNPLLKLRRLLRSRIFARALLVNLSAVSATVLLVAFVFLWIERIEFTGQPYFNSAASIILLAHST